MQKTLLNNKYNKKLNDDSNEKSVDNDNDNSDEQLNDNADNKTKIVNVKVAFIRPKYKNLEEWINDPNNVYIGRGRVVFIDGERYPKNDSMWCNPFKGDGCIEKFEKYIIKKIKNENLYEELNNLKGKNLGCWCKPNSCHGDVILKLINSYNKCILKK